MISDISPALDNVPYVLSRMTEFTTRNTRTKAVVADADGLVLEGVCEVVLAFSHGSDENTDAFP